jgi:hypothetical protein
MTDEILVARESFTTMLDGETVTVHAGATRVREGHPLLEGREELFEPLEIQYDIEQATDAPGEKRSRSKKKPAKQEEQSASTEADSNPGAANVVVDYSDWKQAKLKEELNGRQITYPGGVGVKNSDLIALLEADDAEKSEAENS